MRRHMVAGGWNPAERGHSTGRPTAPVVARYRCFLPDLAGLAGLRRVGPGTAEVYHQRRLGAADELPLSPPRFLF
jgi:hypothetical protein